LACPGCGQSYALGTKFCDHCGHDLRRPEVPPPIDYTQPPSYTPKHLADQILTTRSALEGERKLVTVLFADVANFTSLSEKLDPEEVHQIMDGCFQILMAEIHRFEGTINQFTGDGVMALFGAPLAHEDHALRACHAALAIQKAMEEYGHKLKRTHDIDFRMRIGLHSGPVVVGKIGDDLRMDYTAIGDTTNLASRLESLAQPGTILLSQDTHHLVEAFFQFHPLGQVEIKGKEEPQQAYQLLQPTAVETRIEAAVSRGLTRFIGREQEISSLLQAYAKVQSGSGQVVGIVGEAGVGKSRMILEFRNSLPEGTCTYLEGRCLHYGGAMAYLPILDILRSYFGIQEGDREHLIKRRMAERVLRLDENLKGVLAPLQELLSLQVEDEAFSKLEPILKRDRTFEALRDLLLRQSQNQPLILAIEDLYWIDPTSQEFLDYLVGWLPNAKILLLLLYRPEYTHPWGSKSYYYRIGLDQLNLSSSAELIAALLQEGEVAPELKEVILTRAAGNPLFMEEFTHTLLENGTIRKENHTYTLTRPPSQIQVPDTIQGIVSARMDRLEENLKRTMQVASVIGRDFAFRLLQAITGMREELKSHLLNLQGLEFIYEKSLFPELEYIFKHALTQEVAYNSLLLKRRKDLHERIGQAIEQLYPRRLEEFTEMLAYHYSRSDNLEKAYAYLKLAGNKASRSYSTWEAFRFYHEALDKFKQLPATTEGRNEERLEVLRSMANPIFLLGFPEDSLQILDEGERLAQETGDRRSLAVFYGKLGLYQTHKGDMASATRYAEPCLQAMEESQDLDLLAPLAADLCPFLHRGGEDWRLVQVAAPVIERLEEAHRERDFFGGRFNAYSGLCAWCAASCGWLGDFAQGRVFFEKGLRFAVEVNHPYSLAFIKLCGGAMLALKGDGKEAIEDLEDSMGYLEDVQAKILLGPVSGWLGHAYGRAGEVTRALAHLERGIKVLQDMGIVLNVANFLACLAEVHFDSGDLESAERTIQEGLELSVRHGAKGYEANARIWMGRILVKKRELAFEMAEESLLHGIRMAEGCKYRSIIAEGHLFLGELYSARGQGEKAQYHLKRAEGMFQDMGMDYWLTQAKTALRELEEEEK